MNSAKQICARQHPADVALPRYVCTATVQYVASISQQSVYKGQLTASTLDHRTADWQTSQLVLARPSHMTYACAVQFDIFQLPKLLMLDALCFYAADCSVAAE